MIEKLSKETIDMVQYAREEDYKQRYPQITPNREDTEHTLQMLWLIRMIQGGKK